MSTDTIEREAAPANILAPIAALQMPDQAAITRGAESSLRMAQSFTIADDDEYAMAADELKAVKAKHKALEDKRTSITGPMNKAMKAINDLFRGPLAALEQAEGMFKTSMLAYTTEKERIAAEARRKAEEAAAAERRRLEEEARQREAQARAEQERIAREEAARAAAAKAEQDRLAREAAEAKARGDAEAQARADAAAAEQRAKDEAAAKAAAEESAKVQQAAALDVAAIQNVASIVVAAPVASAAVKVTGISAAKGYDFTVTDIKALIRCIAGRLDQQPELANLLVADSVKLRAYVKALGMNTNLDGVAVVEKKTMRVA